MANVYVEPRPKGHPVGACIDDYVVEDHAGPRTHHLQNAARGNKMGEK
jgi:hypothetical protein